MKIAVLLPAYNEEKTIVKVVKDFKKELPNAKIYVFDNRSSDNTAKLARKAGAVVVKAFERQGKGYVIQKMFSSIGADVYVMADADDTYPAKDVHKLIEPIVSNEADMVVGTRLENFKKEKKQFIHGIGNKMILFSLNACFPTKIKDMLSGYRVFNKYFVKNINLLSRGFSIETEMTIKALEEGFKIKEVPISYRERPKGSESKLNTFADGKLILQTILELFRDHRPMQFFMVLSFFTSAIALGFFVPIASDVFTGDVSNFTNLILTIFFVILSFQLFIAGFLASSVKRAHDEIINTFRK